MTMGSDLKRILHVLLRSIAQILNGHSRTISTDALIIRISHLIFGDAGLLLIVQPHKTGSHKRLQQNKGNMSISCHEANM